MGDERLQRIQSLQFTDRDEANALVLDLVHELFPQIDALRAELRPLAVSLNSFNGFLHLRDGHRLFFKTHIEPHSIIGEYYNADLLSKAGYPVIRPLYASTDYGKQLLIYDLIESPSVFDVAHSIDQGDHDDFSALSEAQHRADDELLTIYLHSLEWQSADAAAQAPVHQLFHHRLGARYEQFYVGKPFELPGGKTLDWETLCKRQWIVNDFESGETLGEAIARAREVLRPDQPGWSVIGHGDAHNGNVFYTSDGLVYFDPAFAGRHHPLLDLAKPAFHNVRATWMYHPQEVAESLEIDWYDSGHAIIVEHDYQLSNCRKMFASSKLDRVYKPLLAELAKRDEARGESNSDQYNRIIHAAMLCCALLTMNLADRHRFPPEIALLGLCQAV